MSTRGLGHSDQIGKKTPSSAPYESTGRCLVNLSHGPASHPLLEGLDHHNLESCPRWQRPFYESSKLPKIYALVFNQMGGGCDRW